MEVSEGLSIAVDVMGGDHGPGVVIRGALEASERFNAPVILVGDESAIRSELGRIDSRRCNAADFAVEHAPETVGMEDSPSVVVRGKPNSSIRRAFDLVVEGRASSVVSPGNTGAMMAAGLISVGTFPGIVRPAIASFIPKVVDAPPTILLDSGANVDCHAFQLVQFAMMGNFYARAALGIERPRIALLSNGSEISKGTDIIRSAAFSLREIEEIQFVGYVEGRDLSSDIADVVVCDGFVGNIVLKSMEGAVSLVLDSIRSHVAASLRGKLGMMLARPLLRELFSEKLDPSAYGGAPLLGLTKIGIVCHGASNEKAILNGVRVAQEFVKTRLVDQLEQSLRTLELKIPTMYEDGMWGRVGQKFSRVKGKNGFVSRKGEESAQRSELNEGEVTHE
jgi:phosphate acyltransferase